MPPKIRLNTLYCLLVLINLVSCTVKKGELKNTSLSFQNERYDFKEITLKKEVSALFTFSNTGTEALVISNVKTSCGCTVPEWTKERIQPNEKSTIKVVYDAKHPGRFNKTITVFYNGVNSPQKLSVKGEVAYPEDLNKAQL